MRARVVWAVMRTSFREHWRTPEAMFWTYGFPVVMSIALGLAFGERDPAPIEVAVVESAAAEDLRGAFAADPRFGVTVLEAAEADRRMVMGEVDAVVRGDAEHPVLRLDPTRENGELVQLRVERLFDARGGGGEDGGPESVVAIEREDRPGARYIDFLIPGLIGLNLLGAGLWGVGFHLVMMRTKRLLRRLLVAPMGRGEFMLGFLLSRIMLMVPESLLIALFGHLAFGVPMRGSIVLWLLLVSAGALAFTGLGAILASRPRTVEGVSGLMNLFMLPMWVLGGSFFSNARFPDFVQPLVHMLPLTHVNDGLRSLMLGGVGMGGILLPLGVLAGTGALLLTIAVRIFRWE